MERSGYDWSISTHEHRRRAPMHFSARADNARMAARVLWDAMDADLKDKATSVGYGGTPHVAMHEAFLREASLAMELILKALIAQRLELGISKLPANMKTPRSTHNLVDLWNEAELGKPVRVDHQTLFVGKQILMWAGRYAAPTKDEYFDREADEEESLRDYSPGSIKIFTPRSINWEQFEAVYSKAATALWDLRRSSGRTSELGISPATTR